MFATKELSALEMNFTYTRHVCVCVTALIACVCLPFSLFCFWALRLHFVVVVLNALGCFRLTYTPTRVTLLGFLFPSSTFDFSNRFLVAFTLGQLISLSVSRPFLSLPLMSSRFSFVPHRCFAARIVFVSERQVHSWPHTRVRSLSV